MFGLGLATQIARGGRRCMASSSSVFVAALSTCLALASSDSAVAASRALAPEAGDAHAVQVDKEVIAYTVAHASAAAHTQAETPPAEACPAWCLKNTKPWASKCTWAGTCELCSQCMPVNTAAERKRVRSSGHDRTARAEAVQSRPSLTPGQELAQHVNTDASCVAALTSERERFNGWSRMSGTNNGCMHEVFDEVAVSHEHKIVYVANQKAASEALLKMMHKILNATQHCRKGIDFLRAGSAKHSGKDRVVMSVPHPV